MSILRNTRSNSAPGGRAIGLRLMVGAPAVVGLLYLLGLIGWSVRGCPAELAPGRWLLEPAAFPILAFSGLLATVMMVTALGVFGCLALIVGDALIAAWHRLRR